MQLRLVSFNGTNICDDVNYHAYLPLGAKMVAAATPVWNNLVRKHPLLSGKQLTGYLFTVNIILLGTISTQQETIKQLFDPDQQTLGTLIANDQANGNKPYILSCTPYDINVAPGGASEFVISMCAPSSVWLSQTVNQDSWSITATGQQRTITPAQNHNTHPTFVITPTGAKTGGSLYAYKEWRPVYNQTANAAPNYPYDICANALNSASLISGGHMLASGNDVMVMLDGTYTDRWLGYWNQATSRIWINLNLSPKIELPLLGTIAGSGGITQITFKKSTANLKLMKRLPSAGCFYSVRGEAFTYTGVDLKNYKVTGVTRNCKGLAAGMQAHSDGDIFRWIEHDVWLVYGWASATAPVIDNTKQPIFNLDTSTNTSWVYAAFADAAQLRSGILKSMVISSKGGNSQIYTGSQGAQNVDPATYAGMQMLDWQNGTTWQAENASMEWRLSHPFGITTVTSTGDKYRNSSSWPSAVGLQYSNNGKNWSTSWNEASPASASSWTSWTHNAVALGATYLFIRWFFSGGLAAVASGEADFDINGITVTLDSTQTPIVTATGEQANYHLNCTITNTTTGQWISLTLPMGLNNGLTVDCTNKLVTYADGSNCMAAIDWSSVRDEWLDLQPGANVLQYDDVGTTAVTLLTQWSDANN